jgi:hypothetical protein
MVLTPGQPHIPVVPFTPGQSYLPIEPHRGANVALQPQPLPPGPPDPERVIVSGAPGF